MNNDFISRSALLEFAHNHVGGTVGCNDIARFPSVDAEPVRHGCQYCSGEFAEYQHSIHTKVYINTIGKAQALITECNACPPYADCSMRGLPVRSAFVINFCPNCGRRLDAELKHAAD